MTTTIIPIPWISVMDYSSIITATATARVHPVNEINAQSVPNGWKTNSVVNLPVDCYHPQSPSVYYYSAWKKTHFYTSPIQRGRLSNLSIAVRVLMFVILYYMLIIYNTIYKQLYSYYNINYLYYNYLYYNINTQSVYHRYYNCTENSSKRSTIRIFFTGMCILNDECQRWEIKWFLRKITAFFWKTCASTFRCCFSNEVSIMQTFH